jgi:hypothetical protein
MPRLDRRCFLVGSVAALASCHSDAPTAKETGNEDERRKGDGQGAGPPSHAETAERSAEPADAAAPKPEEPKTDPLARLFTGPKEEGVVWLRLKSVKGHPIFCRVPPGWRTNRDDASVDYVDDEVMYFSKNSHSKIWLGVQGKKSSLAEKEVKFNTQRVSATKAVFDAPIDGQVGTGNYAAKVAKGTCEMFNKPSECWYAIVDYKPDKSLVIFASVRTDVYPERKGQMISILRSLEITVS